MGRAIEMGMREQLIVLKQEGNSLLAISDKLGLSLNTVRKLSARLRQQGNLQVHYQNCGAKQPRSDVGVVRAACWLKRLHPLWGAPLIHLKLSERYPKDKLVDIRTLQRWFRRRQLIKPPQHLHLPCIGRSLAPHNIWQVDAKENLTLLNGTPACYLSITDEHSGAALAAVVFPPQPDCASATGACPPKTG